MNKKRLVLIGFFLLIVQTVLGNTYIADIGFTTSKTVYMTNERIELKGNLYLSNYSTNGTLLTNHSAFENASLNFSIINKYTGNVNSSYVLNTTTNGEFYSRSDYYTTAPLISAPSVGSEYYIRLNYTDPNGTNWWTQAEIQVVNQTIDKIAVSADKVKYDPSQSMIILVEAISKIGDRITYIPNVSINGSIRSTSKTRLTNFNCTTGANGKCTVSATAPSSYGNYFVEVNNFKAFSSFKVRRFDVNIGMKDELGQSIKHTFNTGDQASVEVGVITNSTSETYTFSGVIKDTSKTVVNNITSTTLNYSNTYTNRYTLTLDALNFQVGTYFVEVNVTKSSGGTVGATTSFKVKSWDLKIKKKDTNSGFDYEYSAFPSTVVNLEIYPKWRGNGSIIDNINTTTSVNISVLDNMNNEISAYNSTWNASCGKEGCYELSITTPSNAGEYYVSVIMSHNGETQARKKRINVITASIFATSTDKDGALKDLFNANDFAYISLTSKNTTADVNLTDAKVVAVTFMNGSEYSYSQVDTFDLVNSTNSDFEWAWNESQQRLKLDTPENGGLYTVYITGENSTAATSTRLIVNPYDVCLVAKNTPGQVSSGYYYVYQFTTSDTIYYELKVTQASNPAGRASFSNNTNSSYGMGSACADQSSTKQVVNNATITIEEVFNTQTGKKFSLNTTASSCQSDDSSGSYTCTIKPLGNWDGGSYGVKFKLVGIDGQSDYAFGGFEARAFYLYAWSSSWQNKPTSNIALTVQMYEAGDSWWGNYGSGGLSGTVELEKIEYQGREGEWLWPPIEYNYNVSNVNTSTITNGQGTLTLSANNTLTGQWKTGSYRAILKGTDNGGETDYGYAYFSIRQWQVYASPVDCSGNSCTSVYNINSKSNISLYVTINNAGEWGQSGSDLGGEVTISVKKLQDCRRWPCTDLNTSLFNSTSITVNTSSGWYWGSVDTDYIINLTPTAGTWGTGYWQAVLDVNNTETGTGWFNTIAFYVEAQPTDVTGNTWKYSVKNNEPMYFKVTTVKTQKNGYYYSSYNSSDYLNTTISSGVLRTWDQSTYQSVEHNYPDDFNVSIVGGGTTINGSRILNVTYNNGSWNSGYYNGELTLTNNDGETATANLWFQVRPFRVQISSDLYSIDNDVCINGTFYIYDPDWTSNSVLNGTYNISSVTENTWTGSGNTITTYTNFTPTGDFNGTSVFTVCPNSNKWGSGSWGNYHYLTIKIQNNESNTEDGWLSFRTVPFSVSWSTVVGGTSVYTSNNIVVPVNLSKASSGISSSGNLTRLYQWRYDSSTSTLEEYVFSVGDCYSNVTGTCLVNGSQNVTIYAPSGGWKEGYNSLQAEWTEYDDVTSTVQDSSSIWFNGLNVYSGYYSNVDENGNWKYNFALNDNLTIRIYVTDSSSNAATVNVTKVEYSNPSSTCWEEYCRTYVNTSYSIVGQADNEISGNGIIKIPKPSSNWTKGYYNIRTTVAGENGSNLIKNGQLYVKDLTGPTVNVTLPLINSSISNSSFWINWTTSENANCYVYIYNYDNYHNWYCGSWNSSGNSSNSTVDYDFVDSCNTTKYGLNGSTYYYEYISNNYRSWGNSSSWGYDSGTTGMSTGGTNHYYQYTVSGLAVQDYGIQVYCNDVDWNYGYGYSAVSINVTSSSSNSTQLNVTLLSPANNATINLSSVVFNYSFAGASTANCSLYGNYTGNWSLNLTSSSVSSGSRNFTQPWSNGTYAWNVYCVDTSNASNTDWGDANWTFTNNYVG